MKYAYYPGCSADSTARDQYMSVNEVAIALTPSFKADKKYTNRIFARKHDRINS